MFQWKKNCNFDAISLPLHTFYIFRWLYMYVYVRENFLYDSLSFSVVHIRWAFVLVFAWTSFDTKYTVVHVLPCKKTVGMRGNSVCSCVTVGCVGVDVNVCGRDGKVSKFQPFEQTFYSVRCVVRKRAQHKEFEALQ